MKKIWFTLLIITAVCSFYSCSDDNEGWKNDSPVVGYVLPSYVMKGTQLVIPGKGYAPDAELYFKNRDGVSTKMTPEKIVNTGILFTVPQDMARGVYSVVLRQGGEWELGTTKVAEIIKVKRVKSLTLGMSGEVIGECELKYDDDNRLIAFQAFAGTYTFAYEGNSIKVVSPVHSFNYLLQDGRVVSSEDNGETSGWSYTTDGFLENAAGNNYTYESGNLVTTDVNDMMLAPFEYSEDGPVSPGLIDVAACLMYFNDAMGDVEFMACLLGINGKQSVRLPSGAMFLGNMIYSYENNDPQGDLERFTLDMTESMGFDEFVEVAYEMGDILVME